MQTLLQDLRFGARLMIKNPGFTIICVLTLALGIGANTAIFSVVYGVLLKPLPYKDAERIVVTNISVPDYRDLKEVGRSFDQTALWGSNLYNLGMDGKTDQVRGAIVTPEFFSILAHPTLGRAWRADEDHKLLAVMSHNLWQTRFGGDPNVIGRNVRISGEEYVITGVMPREFEYPSSEYKLWVTFGPAAAKAPRQMENRQLRIFRLVGHLKAGVSIAQLQAEMDALSQQLQTQYPETNAGVRINFTPLRQRIVGNVQRALWVLLGVVGLVLLIAAANVANLSLARQSAREREMAIRSALGAQRGRLIRQAMTESLLLAALGGVVGLLLASWMLDLLFALNPADIPRLTTIEINRPTLLFTLGVVALTALTFGVLPALQSTRGNLSQSLGEGGRSALGGKGGRRLRSVLVVAEIALSLVVLVGAGLLIKSFTQLMRVESGVVAENLLTANVGLVEFKDPRRRADLQRQILERISALPGVQVAGGGTALPPSNPQRGTRFAVEGLPNDNAGERSAYFIAVSPDYFRAIGAPLREGRVFTQRDNADAAKAVVISQTLADNLFPNGGAIGKRLQLVNPEESKDWREIVGVVGDVRYNGLNDADVPTVYTPFAQTPFIWSYLMIRTSAPPLSLMPSVSEAVSSIDPRLEPANFRTMEQLVYESVAQPRFYAALLGAFALLALVLAAIGIYGVTAYSVAQRTREIGLRIALGAQTRDILRLALKQSGGLILIGVAIGVAGAFALTRLMKAMLFEVSATDPGAFSAISLGLMIVALVACYIPARRATKVDPMIALRND